MQKMGISPVLKNLLRFSNKKIRFDLNKRHISTKLTNKHVMSHRANLFEIEKNRQVS